MTDTTETTAYEALREFVRTIKLGRVRSGAAHEDVTLDDAYGTPDADTITDALWDEYGGAIVATLPTQGQRDIMLHADKA